MNQIKPLARKNEIVIQEFNNEVLIYDLKANKAYNLNEPSALIWQFSDGKKTILEIANLLELEFKSKISEEFVWLALEQLRKENLLENNTEISTLYQNTSRREIIKRVGLTTLIALPLVSSLVAPVALHAQSSRTRPLGCSQIFAPPGLPAAYNPQKSPTCPGGAGCSCSPGTTNGQSSPPSNCATGLLCYNNAPIGWTEENPPVATEVPASGLGNACC